MHAKYYLSCDTIIMCAVVKNYWQNGQFTTQNSLNFYMLEGNNHMSARLMCIDILLSHMAL